MGIKRSHLILSLVGFCWTVCRIRPFLHHTFIQFIVSFVKEKWNKNGYSRIRIHNQSILGPWNSQRYDIKIWDYEDQKEQKNWIKMWWILPTVQQKPTNFSTLICQFFILGTIWGQSLLPVICDIRHEFLNRWMVH